MNSQSGQPFTEILSPEYREQLQSLLSDAIAVAIKYHDLTGRPLGITGEVGEVTAANLLGLELAPVRESGYDASLGGVTYQIKTRRQLNKNPGGRIGKIDLNKEWDAVLLVLLDRTFSPIAIYEADRAGVTDALTREGSRARNERGQLSVSKFKSIGRRVWSTPFTQESHP